MMLLALRGDTVAAFKSKMKYLSSADFLSVATDAACELAGDILVVNCESSQEGGAVDDNT